jgi:pentatricopeptide repeat protein
MVSWNTLIGAYAEQGLGHDAFLTFHHMQVKDVKPDDVTFLSIIKACSTMPSPEHGNLVCTYVIDCGLESSRFVGNSLIDMYFKCGSVRDAYGVFECILETDMVSWNTLIVGNIDHQRYKEAFVIFKEMVSCDMDPDRITFDSLLEASTLLASMHYGRLVHFCIVSSAMESDLHLSNTLTDFYSACGRVEDAHNILGRSPEKSTGKWNTTTLRSSAAFHDGDDFRSLPDMMEEDMLASILKACSDVVAPEIGMLLHSSVIESSPGRSVSIGNTFIDMYLNCGNLEDACCVFKAMPERDVVTWTMMIGGYGNRGDYESANRAFKRMLWEGHKPVAITYICLLNACARAGLLDEGCFHLRSMMEIHGLAPAFDHYFAMVNLLGQLGRLAEAEDVLRTIPVSGGDIVGTRTLLSHCKVHGNEILGQQCIDP